VEITASAVSLNVEDVPASRGTEEWGQRAFQVRDPNGVIIELVDWNGAVGA
jgi:hypothetical protein